MVYCTKMFSSLIIQFHDSYLKRPFARRRLVVFCCFQFFIVFTYNKYLLWKQLYQRHFDPDEWLTNKVTACNGNFVGYGNQFLWLKNAQLNQNSMAFNIPCTTDIPKYWFERRRQGTPYTKWLANLEVRENGHNSGEGGDKLKTKRITFAVRRVEAHNLYHTICEIYNIFIVHKLFRIEWKNINILFTDSRPKSTMDEIWSRLFARVMHHEDVKESQIFENLIWTPIGYESPMFRLYIHSLPFISEFSKFFINSFGVTNTKKLNCQSINYTLILRHDYNSHPERLALYQGKVHRKLANEIDIIRAIKSSIGPESNLRTVLLENLSIKEQVEIFTKTDVLIGAHGAGMTHILNLPDHAFVLELRPKKLDNVFEHHFYHFRALSRWRGLTYAYSRSDKKKDDIFAFEINIPLDDLLDQMQKIKCHIESQCSSLDMQCPSLEDP